MDYEEVDKTLSFPIGSTDGTEVCCNVTIFDDLAFEKVEFFFIHVVSERNVINADFPYLFMHIQDNDSKSKIYVVYKV